MDTRMKGPIKAGRTQMKIVKGKPYRILLAEDNKEMRALMVQVFHKAGYEVTECQDGVGLLTHLESFLLPGETDQNDVDLIISDIRMPGFTGMEILEGMQHSEGFPAMILITAFGDEETHTKAANFGVAAMFDKPFDIDDLVAKVHEILPPDKRPSGYPQVA